MREAQNVLFFSPVATHPAHRGNRQRISQVATLFKNAGHNVSLVVGKNRLVTDEARRFWSAVYQLRRAPRWRPTGNLVPFDSWYTPGLGEELRELVVGQDIDVLVFNYVFHSRALDYLPENLVRIIDTHDIFSNRSALHQGRKYSGGFFSCSVEDEAKYLGRANVALAISPDDAAFFESITDSTEIVSLPFFPVNAGFSRGHGIEQRKLDSDERPEFGMVLSANDLNLASLYDFIQAVEKTFPGGPPFRVQVAGDVDKIAHRYFPHRARRFRRNWITYLGSLDDLSNFYSSIHAAVVPVISGSGMAIKFVEAVSRGVPTLSTAAGSRGTGAKQSFHCFADNYELVSALAGITPELLSAMDDGGKQVESWLRQSVDDGWNQLSRRLGTSS